MTAAGSESLHLHHQPAPTRDFYRTKYILAWNPFWSDNTIGPPGSERFVRENCPVSNCFVTADRKLLRAGIVNTGIFCDQMAMEGRSMPG